MAINRKMDAQNMPYVHNGISFLLKKEKKKKKSDLTTMWMNLKVIM